MTQSEGKIPAVIPPLEGLARLRQFTAARIGLGRAGIGLPTEAHLRFTADHARAKDAVYSSLDIEPLASVLKSLDLTVATVRSAARDREEYLRRPDLGRRLSPGAMDILGTLPSSEVALVVADGLSAAAVDANLVAVATPLVERLRARQIELRTAVFVEQGRVASGDPVGEALGARLVIMLIGERPGLSAADSMGCYLTFAPRPGTPDSRRNCISNIRLGGLGPKQAAEQIAWLAFEALRRQVSGTILKADPLHALEHRPHGTIDQ